MAELENQKLNAINSEQFVKQELLQVNDRLKGDKLKYNKKWLNIHLEDLCNNGTNFVFCLKV